MLKQIPSEETPAQAHKKRQQQKNTRKARITSSYGSIKTQDRKKIIVSPKLQEQNFIEIRDQDGKLRRVCLRFIKYVKKGNKRNKRSAEEIGEMIHGLQEGIVCLEKQRQKLLWNKKKK